MSTPRPTHHVRSLIASAASVAASVAVSIAMVACERRPGDTDKAGSPNGEALAATPGRQAPPYTTRALVSVGRLSGTIEIDGPLPSDSVVQPGIDQQVCGAAFTRVGIEARGNRPTGVVVWIDGLRS